MISVARTSAVRSSCFRMSACSGVKPRELVAMVRCRGSSYGVLPLRKGEKARKKSMVEVGRLELIIKSSMPAENFWFGL